MIIDLTKHYVPESYSDSRDYRVFLKLAGITTSVLKNNIDSFISLYSAENCPENLLPYLAELVGYKYNNEINSDYNRVIIKYFPYLLRYRGSAEGFKLATALSLNTDIDEDLNFSLDNILINVDYEKAIITIYCPAEDPIRHDLLESVRPLGMTINIITDASIINNTDEIETQVKAIPVIEKYQNTRHKVNKSKVGFGDVGMEGRVNND